MTLVALAEIASRRQMLIETRLQGAHGEAHTSLGYDVKERKLAVDKAEAATVRYIFRRYLELETVPCGMISPPRASSANAARRRMGAPMAANGFRAGRFTSC